MTTPDVKQELEQIRERDGRDFASTKQYVAERGPIQCRDDRRYLLDLISRLTNDLQSSQCAEQMSVDAEKALRAKVEGLERDARRYRFLKDILDDESNECFVSGLLFETTANNWDAKLDARQKLHSALGDANG
jgi:hypothetical protein